MGIGWTTEWVSRTKGLCVSPGQKSLAVKTSLRSSILLHPNNNIHCMFFFFLQSSKSKDQKNDSNSKESEAKNAKESKSKKDNGAPAKKKKQQVKTVELRVETSVPGLTRAQLQEAIDREVCAKCYQVQGLVCWNTAVRITLFSKSIKHL